MEKFYLALSAYMVAIVWYAHFSSYKLFPLIGKSEFQNFHKNYVQSTSIPIAVPMLFEFLICSYLFFLESNFFWKINFLILVGVWGITFLWSVPMHSKLEKNFDSKILKSLLWSNSIRGFLWTIKLVFILAVE